MQNPFDMYSIQDIIFTTRPEFMLETGEGGWMGERGVGGLVEAVSKGV
jgi:hypothetical protein